MIFIHIIQLCMIIWRKFLILICDPEFKDTPTCSYVGFGGGVVNKLKKTL